MEIEVAAPELWAAFGVSMAVLLAVDLLGHRYSRPGPRTDLIWTVIWIAAGLGFSLVVWSSLGSQRGQEYLAAYLIEKSLSVDNLFVFLMIFGSLKIPQEHQHKVLIYGVLGALVFRLLFVFLGIAALERWEAVNYVFALVLVWAAYRSVKGDTTDTSSEAGLLRWLSRRLPVTQTLHAERFLVREDGKLRATPLLLALLALELTDIVFAVDSVPAALSISRDRFVVYSSNAFAILGLRSLYLVLARTLVVLTHLHYGLAAILTLAALKLVLSVYEIHIPPALSVGAIVAILMSVTASSLWVKRVSRDRPS